MTDGTPSLFEAYAIRDKQLTKLEKRQPDFIESAKIEVLNYLFAINRRATCEEIVDELKRRGIKPETGDDRSFGPVFMALSRQKKIVRVGFEPRRKAHGAPGASVWDLP